MQLAWLRPVHLGCDRVLAGHNGGGSSSGQALRSIWPQKLLSQRNLSLSAGFGAGIGLVAELGTSVSLPAG